MNEDCFECALVVLVFNLYSPEGWNTRPIFYFLCLPVMSHIFMSQARDRVARPLYDKGSQ